MLTSLVPHSKDQQRFSGNYIFNSNYIGTFRNALQKRFQWDQCFPLNSLFTVVCWWYEQFICYQMLHASPCRSARHLRFLYGVKRLIGFLLFNLAGVVWQITGRTRTHVLLNFYDYVPDKICVCSSVNKGEKCLTENATFLLFHSDYVNKNEVRNV